MDVAVVGHIIDPRAVGLDHGLSIGVMSHGLGLMYCLGLGFGLYLGPVHCSCSLFKFIVHVHCSWSLFMLIFHVHCSCSLFMFIVHNHCSCS